MFKTDKVFEFKWLRGNTIRNVIWYKCSKCDKKLKVQPNKLESHCTVFINRVYYNESAEHEEDEVIEKVTIGLPDSVKQKIIEFESLSVKPATMVERLRREGIQVEKSKIHNFLKKYRQKSNGSSKLTLEDLVNWCEAHKIIPENDNDAYVANYEYYTHPERDFRVFLTAKTLIG